ncbi:STM3941 family protein [Chryseobacterium contaminans]|uniref:STM3941 family protein n=1 Tax=Chryseobacterium contaminans TaxID=1423959 RepID=UPI0030180159
MKEHHFYSSKIKSLILLIISCVFTFGISYIDFKDENLFIIVMLCLGITLFSFGILYSILLLVRTEPLLTVTDKQIIVYNVLRKPTFIRFDEVALFFIVDMRHYGIKTSSYICVIMKQPKENTNVIDKVSSTVFPHLKGIRYSIQTDMLNVKAKVLLELLNSRIRPYNL